MRWAEQVLRTETASWSKRRFRPFYRTAQAMTALAPKRLPRVVKAARIPTNYFFLLQVQGAEQKSTKAAT